MRIRYEAIVCSMNDNIPNSASIGVIIESNSVEFKCYEGSNTFKNLLNQKRFSVNLFVRGDEVFIARAALTGWGNSEKEFDDDMYAYFKGVPYLRDAKKVFICNIFRREISTLYDDIGKTKILKIVGNVIKEYDNSNCDDIITREGNMCVEAIILATKVKASSSHELKERYLSKCRDVLSRIDDEEVYEIISKFIEKLCQNT